MAPLNHLAVTSQRTVTRVPACRPRSFLPAPPLARIGGLPPLVLDNVSDTELKNLCQEMYNDLGFLAGIIPERFGPIVSTCATGGAAVIAGTIDGILGAQNK